MKDLLKKAKKKFPSPASYIDGLGHKHKKVSYEEPMWWNGHIILALGAGIVYDGITEEWATPIKSKKS